MKKEFVDSSNKIITSCPKCQNQASLYLISSNQLKTGTQVQWCENCELPYLVDIKTELTCEVYYYSCEKVKENSK